MTAPYTAAPVRNSSLFGHLALGALYLLLLLAPQQLSGFWPVTYDYQAQTLFLLLSAGVTLILALSPHEKRPLDTVSWLILAFFGWSALSFTTSVYKHDSLLEISRVGGALTWFFIARSIYQRENTVWLATTLVLGLVLVSVPALQDFWQTKNPRQFGTFYNPNLFANALAIGLPFALALPILARRRFGGAAWLCLTLFLILLLGLAVTSSKGGFVAALGGLLVFFLAVWRAKKSALGAFARKNWLVLGIGTAILLLAGGAVAGKTILPRLLAARGADDNSTMFRVYTWKGTLAMVKARPILGWGAGSFPSAYPQFAQTGYTRSAHESWLQIAAENGIPALVFLVGAFLVALGKGWRRLQNDDWPLVAASLGGLVAFALHGLFDAGWGILSITLLIFTLLAVLSADEHPNFNEERAPKSGLNFAWLGATLLLALGGYSGQNATAGELARDDADRFLQNGGVSAALQKAQESIESDPMGSRGYLALARVQKALGQSDVSTLRRATQVQPTRSAHWSNLAWSLSENGGSKAEIIAAWQRAVELDPNNTDLLLQRAGWRQKNGDLQGAQSDLQAILKLRDAPYGRYPATPEWVELDFARATVALGEINPKLVSKTLVQRGLEDVERARQNVERQREIVAAAGEWTQLRPPGDLDGLANALSALQ